MSTLLKQRVRPTRLTRRKQKGAALVEFAFVLPIFLLLVFGIAEFGVALYDKAVITNAAREGARAGVVLENPKPSQQYITSVVTNYTSTYLLSFASKNPTPAVTITGSGGTFGQPLTVNVSYQYTGLVLAQLMSLVSHTASTGPLALTLQSTAVMNNE